MRILNFCGLVRLLLGALLCHHANVFCSTIYGTLQVSTPVFSPIDSYYVLSVSVSISCATEGAAIRYTTDGSTPTLSSLSIVNGASIIWDIIGDTTFSARAFKSDYIPSPIAHQQYTVVPRCLPPVFYPPSGSYFGSLSVCMTSSTVGATIFYETNATDPTFLSPSVPNGGCIALTTPGEYIMRSFAAMSDYGSSLLIQSNYLLLPETMKPTMLPTTSTFLSIAVVYISSSTPSSVIYYSIDSPVTLTSTNMPSGSSFTIDQVGHHTIYAFASSPHMHDSEIVSKVIQVLEPSFKPIISPNSGEFINHVDVTITSTEDDNATIIYTIDGSDPVPHQNGISQFGLVVISISNIGITTIKAISISHGKGQSGIQSASITIILSPYVEHLINVNQGFSVEPDISIHHIQSKINYQQIRGRYIVLKNPINHFSFLPPVHGCESGIKSLPSNTGQSFIASSVLKVDDVEELNALLDARHVIMDEYKSLQVKSCQLVSNAGFFNTTTGHCLGDLVSESKLIQTSDRKTVNFGIRDKKFVTGYISNEEISSHSGINSFDTLISGYIWLVRDGQVYVTESAAIEDDGFQSTGSTFISVKSARTAVGHNSDGELIVVQVEGETWVSGLGLLEFASLLVELNVLNAINLDGGGSATMSQNNSMIGDPSWLCDGSDNLDDLFRCEKEVSSVMCMYASDFPTIIYKGKVLHIDDDFVNVDDATDDVYHCNETINGSSYNHMKIKLGILQEKNDELRSMLIFLLVLLVLSIGYQLWPKVTSKILNRKRDLSDHFQPSSIEMTVNLNPKIDDTEEFNHVEENANQHEQKEETEAGIDETQLDDDLDRFYLEPKTKKVSVGQSWMQTKKKLYEPLRNLS